MFESRETNLFLDLLIELINIFPPAIIISLFAIAIIDLVLNLIN